VKALRSLLVLATALLVPVCLAANHGWQAIPRTPAFCALLGLSLMRLFLDWPLRKNHPHKEPSPAQSVRNVILATGLAAAIAIALTARSTEDYLLSAGIALASMVLALLAYRLADKYADKIGEARFDTGSKTD
jgi:hypothetical protein